MGLQFPRLSSFKCSTREYTLVVMLTLSTLNYGIPKIINYCELYNTQDRAYTLIFCLLLNCNSWHVSTISKLCFSLIYNALLSRAFSSCDSCEGVESLAAAPNLYGSLVVKTTNVHVLMIIPHKYHSGRQGVSH